MPCLGVIMRGPIFSEAKMRRSGWWKGREVSGERFGRELRKLWSGCNLREKNK